MFNLLMIFLISYNSDCFNINNSNLTLLNKSITFKYTSNPSFKSRITKQSKTSVINSNNIMDSHSRNFSSMMDSDNLNGNFISLKIPNTIRLNKDLNDYILNKFHSTPSGKSYVTDSTDISSIPVLSIDFGSRNIGISLNYMNEFKLFKRIKNENYRQVTDDIVDIINNIKKSYIFSKMIILVGISYNRYEPSNGSIPINIPQIHSNYSSNINFGIPLRHQNSPLYTDLRLLFQILYTLDFSFYLSNYLYNTFNNSYRNDSSIYSPTSTPQEDIPNKLLYTHCLYCSLTENVNSNPNCYHRCNVHNSLFDESSGNTSNPNCRITLNLGEYLNSNLIVVGTSEQSSTYQSSNLKPSSKIPNPYGNCDTLSTLNIYYNFINSFMVTSNPLEGSEVEDEEGKTYNKTNKDNKDKDDFDNFLILPSNSIFNNSKSNNILLYKYIKNYIIKSKLVTFKANTTIKG